MLTCALQAFANALIFLLNPYVTYVLSLQPGYFRDSLVVLYTVFIIHVPAVVIGTILLGLSLVIPVTLGCPYLTSVSRKLSRFAFGVSHQLYHIAVFYLTIVWWDAQMPRLSWYIYNRMQTAVEDILTVLFIVIGKITTSYLPWGLRLVISWLLWVPMVLFPTIWKYTIGIWYRTLLKLAPSPALLRKSTLPLVSAAPSLFIYSTIQ